MANQQWPEPQFLSRPELMATLRDLLADLFLDPGPSQIVVGDAGITAGYIAFDSAAIVRWDSLLDRKDVRFGMELEIAIHLG